MRLVLLLAVFGPAQGDDVLREHALRFLETGLVWTREAQFRMDYAQVGSHQGTWITLTHTFLQQRSGQSDPTRIDYDSVREDFQLLAFKSQFAPRGNAKDIIAWPTKLSPFHRTSAFLGEYDGYHWYAKGRPDQIARLMRISPFRGGDSVISLLVDALAVVDNGMMTRNSAAFMLRDEGDLAVAAIRSAVATRVRPDLFVAPLGHIRTDAATALLVDLQGSTNREVSNAAALALSVQPYRAGAKPAYLRMAANAQRVADAAAACSEYGWKESVGSLRKALDIVRTLGDYHTVLVAERFLSGNAVPLAALNAATTIRESAMLGEGANVRAEQAKSVLLGLGDKHALGVIGVGLAIHSGKGDVRIVNTVGLDLLRSVPVAIRDPLLAKWVGQFDVGDAAKVQSVIEQLR